MLASAWIQHSSVNKYHIYCYFPRRVVTPGTGPEAARLSALPERSGSARTESTLLSESGNSCTPAACWLVPFSPCIKRNIVEDPGENVETEKKSNFQMEETLENV